MSGAYPFTPKLRGRPLRERIAATERFIESLRVKHAIPRERLYPEARA